MNDALEVLNELEDLVKGLASDWNEQASEDIWSFINNQRSIYQPARGECAV